MEQKGSGNGSEKRSGKRNSLQTANLAWVKDTDPFFQAIQADDVEQVEALLGMGRKATECDREMGKSALHFAAQAGAVATIPVLIKNGADVNFDGGKFDISKKNADQKGAMGRLPIHDAAVADQGAAIRTLHQHNSWLDTPDASGATPLFLAAEFNCLDSVIALCEVKANLNAVKKNDHNRTALHIAIIKGHSDVAIELIRRGAKLDVLDGEKHSPYYYAQKSQRIMAALVAGTAAESSFGVASPAAKSPSEKAYLMVTDLDDNNTPLHLAAREGMLILIDRLCDRGADKEARNDDDFTPLLMAAAAGQKEAMELLKKRGANDAVLYRGNNTLLHCLARNGRKEYLETAIQWIDEDDPKNSDKKRPLPNIDFRNENLDSPVHFAAVECHLDALTFLCQLTGTIVVDGHEVIRKRFDLNPINEQDETPLELMLTEFQLDLDDDEDDDEINQPKIEEFNTRIKTAIDLFLQGGAIVRKETVDLAEKNSHLYEATKQQIREAFAKQPKELTETQAKHAQEEEAKQRKQIEEAEKKHREEEQRLREETEVKQREEEQRLREEAERKQREEEHRLREEAERNQLQEAEKLREQEQEKIRAEELEQQRQGLEAMARLFLAEMEQNPTETADTTPQVEASPPENAAPAPVQPRVVDPKLSSLISHFQTLLATQVSKENNDLSEFLALLKDTNNFSELSTLRTKSGKNILHIVATYDPSDAFMPLLFELTQQIKIDTLLTMKTNNGESPFHLACFHHNLNIIEYYVRNINPQKLLALAAEKTFDAGYNAFHLLCISSYNEQTHASKLKFDTTFSAQFTVRRNFVASVPTHQDLLGLMHRFTTIFAENIDALICATDNNDNTGVMLCTLSGDENLLETCLGLFHNPENKQRMLEFLVAKKRLTPLQLLCGYGDAAMLRRLLPHYAGSTFEVCKRHRALQWVYRTTAEVGDEDTPQRTREVVNILIPVYGDNLARSILSKNLGNSVLLTDLHQQGIITNKLLERKILSQRYDMLLELMCDIVQHRPAVAPAAAAVIAEAPVVQRNAPPSPRLFHHNANMGVNQHSPTERRTQLLANLCSFQWPEELLQHMASLITATVSGAVNAERNDSRATILRYIRGDFANLPAESLLIKSPLYSHVILALALFYKVTNNLSDAEASFVKNFKENPLWLNRVLNLYEYLNRFQGRENADQFLRQLHDPKSLLNVAFVAACPMNSFLDRDDVDCFVATVRHQFGVPDNSTAHN